MTISMMIHVLLIKLIPNISLIGEVMYVCKWAFPTGMTCGHLARVKVGCTYEIEAPIRQNRMYIFCLW